MIASKKNTPLIYAYLRKYQEDPTSRVFAPLAEAYRKAGMPHEAVEIAHEGLKHHPNFIGGRVALARALFDLKKYTEVIEELAPRIRDVPDNLIAQRLLGDSFLVLGLVAEALSSFKMLLYYAPQDVEVAKMVQELESQAYSQGRLILKTQSFAEAESSEELPMFDIRSVGSVVAADPAVKKARHIERIEKLQTMLSKIATYRAKNSNPQV